MDSDLTRRGLVGAIAAGATAGGFLGPVRGYLSGFAPLSGGVWRTARAETPDAVDSPHGTAQLRHDDHGVARVEGDSEAAVYFAAGYAQGRDRLFQMDLQRRQMRGQLSAVVGTATVDSDRFHRQMDFAGAASATWDRIGDTEVGPLVEAFCDGVNRAREDHPLPVEFQLLDAEPAPWTPTDVMLAEKQIAWGLTGNFQSLRRETLAAEVDPAAVAELLPRRLDHDATILGHPGATESFSPAPERVETDADRTSMAGTRTPFTDREPTATHPELAGALSAQEPPPWVGSNSWAVGGDHTASGAALLANDPHLTLQAPPVWYEQVLSPPGYRVRGVTFPGVPPVVIGENDHGAWGFTNANADVLDCYRYETRADGAEYRYGDEWRAFETDDQTIPVADGDDQTVTVRRSVHGVVLDRAADGDELRPAVGVAWTGLSATDTTLAVRDLNRSTGVDDAADALRRFDEPTQCCVYADRDGEILYRVTGKVPIRRTDGEPVSGDRVFDGSAREGEWPGYTPFGESSWDGAIPYAEMPHVRNPEYVGTANQRVVDDSDYPHYLAASYSPPDRGRRLWDRLDALVDRGDVTPEDLRALQGDVVSERARRFQSVLAESRSALPTALQSVVDELTAWDARLDRDSRAALVFSRFLTHYRTAAVEPVLADELDDRRDPGEYTPNDWVLAGLPPDSRWFPEGRAAAVERALRAAVEEIDANDWEVYGDAHQTTVTHPFDRGGLNYDAHPTDGSAATLFNVHDAADAGSSWRQVCPLDDRESRCILPGGNDGSPFGANYGDQLRAWADNEFKRMDRTQRGELTVSFGGDE